MNFFEHQERARRQTSLLVFLFALAVVGLIGITWLLVTALISFYRGDGSLDWQQLVAASSMGQLVTIGLSIVSVVLIASLFRFMQLGKDGRPVAEAMGGKPVAINTSNFHERRLLNVVEEMAIASGMPVPPVYIMEDSSINAFAAGYNPNTAVIGVTRGCVEFLNREEMQGVIAHEFSHIFNGDMKLNMRLIGVLHGILIIGIAGRIIFRMVSRTGYRGRSNRNQSALPFIVIGAGLMAVGYMGTFFGNLIKAAVSRQREFLADASAVQYTRNPLGISHALQKIGGLSAGSAIETAEASEFSHLFFGQALKPVFNMIMATHPPLPERIRRVTPNWDGRFPRVREPTAPDPDSMAQSPGITAAAFAQVSGAVPMGRLGIAIDEEIGKPDDANELLADRLVDAMPQNVRAQSRDVYGARALVYCLLLDGDAGVKAKQMGILEQNLNADLYSLVKVLDSPFTREPLHRLKLIDLCVPALKELSAAQYRSFKSVVVKLIKADEQVALYEWALYRVMVAALEGIPKGMRASLVPSIKYVAEPLALLLSAVAISAAESAAQAQAAFSRGKDIAGLTRIRYHQPGSYSLRDLSIALLQLNRLKPLHKPKCLKALVATAAHDEVLAPTELELIRAVSDCIDCPMPIIQ